MQNESNIDNGLEEMKKVQTALRRLERHDWWLWWAAVVVMLLLTVAVVSLSLPTLMEDRSNFFQFNLEQAVRGLVGLVLLFNTYTIYQQVLIKRLRSQMAGQIELMASLRLRANEYHKLAMIDPLTGLYNRRFAEHRLQAEVDRSRRCCCRNARRTRFPRCLPASAEWMSPFAGSASRSASRRAMRVSRVQNRQRRCWSAPTNSSTPSSAVGRRLSLLPWRRTPRNHMPLLPPRGSYARFSKPDQPGLLLP